MITLDLVIFFGGEGSDDPPDPPLATSMRCLGGQLAWTDDLDCHQNLSLPFTTLGPSIKMSSKPIHNVLSNVASMTNKQTKVTQMYIMPTFVHRILINVLSFLY